MLKVIEDAAALHGGLVKLAREIGISHQSFYSWKRIPADRVLQFERLTGIDRKVLRPDLARIFVDAEDDGERAA